MEILITAIVLATVLVLAVIIGTGVFMIITGLALGGTGVVLYRLSGRVS